MEIGKQAKALGGSGSDRDGRRQCYGGESFGSAMAFVKEAFFGLNKGRTGLSDSRQC